MRIRSDFRRLSHISTGSEVEPSDSNQTVSCPDVTSAVVLNSFMYEAADMILAVLTVYDILPMIHKMNKISRPSEYLQF